MPRMPFIGVRISCDMFARNSLLAWFAASAFSLATVFSRICSSMSLNASTSVPVSSPLVRSARSEKSCSADTRRATFTSSPSGRVISRCSRSDSASTTSSASTIAPSWIITMLKNRACADSRLLRRWIMPMRSPSNETLRYTSMPVASNAVRGSPSSCVSGASAGSREKDANRAPPLSNTQASTMAGLARIDCRISPATVRSSNISAAAHVLPNTSAVISSSRDRRARKL